MRIDLPDLAAMDSFGAAIAARLRPGDVVALSGGLGAGKTTLARAIIRALGYAGEVPSPSFAILEVYEPPALRLPLVHADFYRLAAVQDAAELGLDDYRDEAALIAEWPENGGNFAAESACLWLDIEIAEKIAESGRIAVARAGADWLGRLPWM